MTIISADGKADHGEGVGHDSTDKVALDELNKRKIDLADMSDTATMEPLRCQSCPRVYNRGGQGTLGDRARAADWIVWEGTTLGGEQARRVYCAVCLGRAKPEDDPLTWDARCDTCDATACEDLEAAGPLTENDVKDWRRDHQCEPWVDLITPEQVQAENDRRQRRRQAVAP